VALVQVKLRAKGETLVVQMRGELDHHAATGLRTEIDTRLAENKIKNVLFNFRDVDFMDSSGFGMILGRYKAVREKGGKVLACSLRPPVRRVFELGGLTTRIPVFGTEQEALDNLWGGEDG
jgi:stage II sporulation protein AA (anti-sigma F factor antagonist)